MTATNMDLKELLEKTADTDFLREMIGFTAQRLMELEVETLTGAPLSSRTADRLTHRNGYRAREWETEVAPVSWTSERLRSRSPRWPRQGYPMHLSSVARWLNR